MNSNIVIIHYNTPYLTECLVRSINLFVRDAVIYIFDNSDKSPFVAKFDNVTILDNTEGQIINFDEWLKKYPRRSMSHGRVNGWGSAKHCYSVEKCMELIGENFFLLDSDILLKRDISELADNECIYVGETVNQPNSSVKRLLPFLCYINVDMCRENGIHYFDHDYMHGLAYTVNNSAADSYDTGGGFYIHASKFKHKDINLNNYMIHFGHGSWNKKGEKIKYTAMDWLKIHKRLWSNEKNKKVIYTCITGKYDSLLEPKKINDGFDYVCFTDNPEFKSSVWNIRPLPDEVKELSQIKKQRYIKLNPHKFLPEYDISVWVDGNVEVRGDVNTLLKNTMRNDCSVYVPKHPTRVCIYAESKAVLAMKKDTKEIVDPQMKRYKAEGFPEKFGLLQSNIMIRRHNNEDCIRLMEAWTKEIIEGSHRDQLSFNYCCWKNKDIMVKYLDAKIYDSEWFHWHKVHKRRAGNNSLIISKHTPNKSPNSTSMKERLERNREAFRNIITRRRMETHNVMIY